MSHIYVCQCVLLFVKLHFDITSHACYESNLYSDNFVVIHVLFVFNMLFSKYIIPIRRFWHCFVPFWFNVLVHILKFLLSLWTEIDMGVTINTEMWRSADINSQYRAFTYSFIEITNVDYFNVFINMFSFPERMQGSWKPAYTQSINK